MGPIGLTLLPDLARSGSTIAFVDPQEGGIWTYEWLSHVVARVAESLGDDRKGIVAWVSRSTAPAIAAYLGALASGHAVMPVSPKLSEPLLRGLFEVYQPDVLLALSVDSIPESIAAEYDVVSREGVPGTVEELVIRRRRETVSFVVHPDTCLLLSTSGSTGSPKMVRLSARNVESNALAIIEALGISADERAVSSLPLFYSYGLSVLHSHLLAGARLILTERSVMEPEFWDVARTESCTSLAAVPHMYGMLDRIAFDRLAPGSLRTLTQAGGKMSNELISRFGDRMARQGGQLFVMYGQTEATARITVLPPNLLSRKLGGVGFPLRGGRLEIRGEEPDRVGPGSAGEIIYRGPNVMLGYAMTRRDLERGDDLRGVLETGDLGHVDRDGCLFVTGRSKRIAKVFGLRVSLDEVEARLASCGPVAVTGGDDALSVFTDARRVEPVRAALAELAREIRIHPSAFRVRTVRELPLLPNGKVDYASLSTQEMAC